MLGMQFHANKKYGIEKDMAWIHLISPTSGLRQLKHDFSVHNCVNNGCTQAHSFLPLFSSPQNYVQQGLPPFFVHTVT